MKSQKDIKRESIIVTVILASLGLLFLVALWASAGWNTMVSGTLLLCTILIFGALAIMLGTFWQTLRSNKDMLALIYTDPVTKGSNFSKFKLDAAEIFRKNPQGKYVIFYSDIKNFKYINDVYGFEAGNKVLQRYSDLLGAEHKLAYARVNADNFVSIETYIDEAELVKKCLQRIERISDISGIIAGNANITVFVGAYCTEGHNDALSIDDMIDRANIAQKQLKNREVAGCVIYNEDFRAKMLAEQDMENRMRPALANGEFVVYLQPKIDISTHKIAAAEALVRWCDPQNGLISPGRFIPLFERNGFIQQLDTFMFEQVCILIRKWLDEGKHILPVSVNVSKVQLNNPTFLQDYMALKAQYGIPDNFVEIEFTESMFVDNSQKMAEVLAFFKTHGFRSSIDDFGSGYSSLNLLKSLPTDILKLDKVFFDKNEYHDREKVIIKNVIAMAKELSMQTVAEGVEQWEQVDFLQSVACEQVQGYIFDRPLPIDLFEKKYIAS